MNFINKKSCEEFDRFISGRSFAYENYDCLLYAKLDFEIKNCGFIEDSKNFFLSSDKGLYFYTLSDDFKSINRVSDSISGSINNIVEAKQHFDNNRCFLLSRNDSVVFYNSETGTQRSFPSSNKHTCGWIPGGVRFLDINLEGKATIYDVEKQDVTHVPVSFANAKFVISHPNTNYILISDGFRVDIYDDRADSKTEWSRYRDEISALAFFKCATDRIVVGFKNGSIEARNLSTSDDSGFRQQVSRYPISKVEFSNHRHGVALMSSKYDLVFANLGRVIQGQDVVSKIHQGHLGTINDVSWCKSDGSKVISADSRGVLNIFSVPDEFIPLTDSPIL